MGRVLTARWTDPLSRLVLIQLGLAAFLVGSGVRVEAAPGSPPGGGLIAEIRHLGGSHVGERVRLAAAGVDIKQMHVAWEFERRPPASKAKFAKHTAVETSFDADVPGLYVVRLTIRLKNVTGTASLGLGVTESGPLVPVNTIDTDEHGNPGITVGGQFYQDPGNGTGFHILVLNRDTLELQYSGIQPLNYALPATSQGITTMESNFKALDNTSLVFVTLPAGAGPLPSNLIGPLNGALATIGGVLPGRWFLADDGSPGYFCWASETPDCNGEAWTANPVTYGSLSVLGVPGLAVGQAWYDSAAQRGATDGTDGPLVGYLTLGYTVGGGKHYTFVFGADQYVLVDSCAFLTQGSCAIGVGKYVVMPPPPVTPTFAQTFAPQPGVNGFNVVILDRVTLQPLAHQTVTSTTALSQLLANPGSGLVGHFQLSRSSELIVVVIQSVGTGALTNNSTDQGVSLLQQIDQLGGTPETFAAAITEGKPYALIGVHTNLPWHGRGIESSPVISATLPGRARSVLARDRQARYTPGAGDPVGTFNLDLLPIIYQDPQPWPYAGSCAIPYIANAIGVGDAYADIRSGYPNIQDWGNRVTYIPASPPPCLAPSEDYTAITTQLTHEFDWVDQVYDLIQHLKEPLQETQASNQNIVATVANEVYNSIKPPPQAATSFSWVNLFDLTIAVAEWAAPEASAVLGIVGAAGDVAAGLMASSPSGNPATVVLAEALNLASQLDAQVQTHLDTLDLLFGILVADAGKLQLVGTNLLDNLAWAWGPSATGDAVNTLNATTQQTVYSALLPPTWPVYNLKPDLTHQFSAADVSTFGCGWENQEGDGGVTHTFASALPANQFQARFQLVPGEETSTTEVWTFGIVDPYFNEDGAKATVPSTSLTDSLFSTGPGGAAAYPPAWYRSTYNPPSHVICGNVKGSNVSHQAPPPVIPPTAAAADGG